MDNDCDGIVPADELDGDGDGFSACQETATTPWTLPSQGGGAVRRLGQRLRRHSAR
ncbi:MAG: hypothetical protein H6559_01765 [Lewinellaceae bacterium]|nr:hypothetical protein [Lewinellaceae bacterium]